MSVGAIWTQKGRPITFASIILNAVDRVYSITERECFAVIWALNKFHSFFTLLPEKADMDHSALTKLTDGKGLSSRVVWWYLKLVEFNVVIQYKAGKKNALVDALSRNSTHKVS